MKQVFVSYSSSDEKIAFEIVNNLEAAGVSCFIAKRDIDAGKPYAKALMEAIDNCELVALIMSSSTLQSEHVLNEVEAVNNKHKTILPILIENIEMTEEFKYYLARKQWVIAFPEDVHIYLGKIRESIIGVLPEMKKVSVDLKEPETTVDASRTKVFEYIPERGVMKNLEDHQRNVSFRTETFINMMGGIYEKVENMVGENEAENIFFNSGYESGKNFAESRKSDWDFGYNIEGFKLKFNEWCKFDSNVGWGKFSANLEFNEESDSIGGTICINEAFIVDNKNKRKICSFIKGYCDGVAEVLLNSSKVELTCVQCPLKSKFKTECVFKIETK